jgi:ABC-type multidrug transport system permease subunit
MPRFGEHPLWRLTQMRLRELAREPGTLFWIFGFPLLLTLGLGVAFRGSTRSRLDVGLVEPAPDAWAETLSRAGFDVVRLGEVEAGRRLAQGALALVVLPPRADASAARTGLRYRFDPARPESRLARLSADDALQRAWGRVDAVPTRDEPSVAPGARYVDFLVPGLIGMNVMSGSMWAIGWAIVNLRVRKLLKRLLATPLRRGQLLMSLLLSRLVVVPIEIASILLFARVFFGVRVAGSLAILAVVALLGALSFGGLAILVASRARNVETVSGLINAVMLPMFVLSGVFFSTAHFPEALQPLIAWLPLSALTEALRSVMIQGAGWAVVAAPCATLAAWGLLGYAAGLRLFRWS